METTKQTIQGVMISCDYEFKSHNVNANDLGSPKKDNNEHSYISGQKIRHMIFQQIKELNEIDEYIVSDGDSQQANITTDIRSDLGGYMKTEGKGSYSNTRPSPINVAFSHAKKESTFFEDCFVRFKNNMSTDNTDKQRINSKELSFKDVFSFNAQLICAKVGTDKITYYEKNKYIKSVKYQLIPIEERKRRILLFIKSLAVLNGLANQARNAVENGANRMIIIFDNQVEFIEFFNKSEQEQEEILKILDDRNSKYFIARKKSEISQIIKKSEQYLINNNIPNQDCDVITHDDFEKILKDKNNVTDKKK